MAENPNLDTALECLAFQFNDMQTGISNLSDTQLVMVAVSLLEGMDKIIRTAINDAMRKAIYQSIANAVVNGSAIAEE